MTRGMSTPQFGGDFGESKPLGNFSSGSQTLAQLSAGDIEHALIRRHLILREVRSFALDKNHALERHCLNFQFLFVCGQQLLRLVWSIKRFACRILAGSRMIASDDDVRAAVVLPNDGVPHRFAWSSH